MDPLGVDPMHPGLDPPEAEVRVRVECAGGGAGAEALAEAKELLEVAAGGVLSGAQVWGSRRAQATGTKTCRWAGRQRSQHRRGGGYCGGEKQARACALEQASMTSEACFTNPFCFCIRQALLGSRRCGLLVRPRSLLRAEAQTPSSAATC